MFHSDSTICAIASPAGGAICIIRISGPEAIPAADSIFQSVSGRRLSEQPPYSVCFGHITDKDGSIVDEVLATVFHAPHSYTGEDSVELSCHGSEYIAGQVISLLIDNGCSQAKPGEFTQRAFLSGKMDLSQAEAVADLISSSTKATHDMALNQMRGGFRHKIEELRSKLLELTSLMELELDFGEEDVTFADRSLLDRTAAEIEQTLANLSASFKTGNAIRNGVAVAIVGRTNTGKSTLLNQLVEDERAIVSDIQGTTRDSIEDSITLNGILFRFIDTAGIRNSDDTIERIGIERSLKTAEKADIVLVLSDCSNPQTENDPELEGILSPLCKDCTLIRVHNKCDLIDRVPNSTNTDIYISAKQGIGIDLLRIALTHSVPDIYPEANGIIITNIRHFEAISKALESIRRARTGIKSGIAVDFISQDTRECIHHLSDILGEVTTDQVLQHIFSHFCIGK